MSDVDEETWDRLVSAAREVAERAYAPYSNFHVGAAILGDDDEIYVGCNIENATYGATVCAERNAIASAVGQGVRDFEALAVVTGADHAVAPCGICRQVIAEFAGNLPILFANDDGDRQFVTLDELLPHRFSEEDF